MSDNGNENQKLTDKVDVVVVGGGAAGLAAAVVLARSRRSVLVVDAHQPRNAPSAAVHNYLFREGMAPLDLLVDGRAEATRYGAQIAAASVISASALAADEPIFDVVLDTGAHVTCRRVVLATGVQDQLPELPGLADRWGIDVLHCPYCHGWEFRDRHIGILATGPTSLHQAGLFRQLTDRVTVFVQGSELSHADRIPLIVRGVNIIEDLVTELVVDGNAVVGVRLESGELVSLDALAVQPYSDARCTVASALGVEERVVDFGGVAVATALAADQFGATEVRGVYVAGNAAEPFAGLLAAAASGNQVGSLINADLVAEDTRSALSTRWTATSEPEAWEQRYGASTPVWSGRVNPQIPVNCSTLTPGRAVDVGCGEGADVIWLAQHGWDATGIDFSAAGLDRARDHADTAGVLASTTWAQEDVRTWQPQETWDLVTSHYLHLPSDLMLSLVERLADAVAPGGTLLVVGHHPHDMAPDHLLPKEACTAEDLAAALDSEVWAISTVAAERTGTGLGAGHVVRDSILCARRRRRPISL